MEIRNNRLPVFIFWFQGIYTLITALWAIVDIHSFMLVSGCKTDTWLVKTVSVVLLAISISFLMSAYRKRYYAEMISLSITSAIGLAFIDFYYSFHDIILPVYCIDGFIQLLCIVLWLFSMKVKT